MDIYDRIEILLKKNRLNKKQLCENTSISYNTLASLFRRRSKNVDLETIKKIAFFLNTTIEYLITGNETYLLRADVNKDLLQKNNQITAVTRSGEKFQYNFTDEDMQTILSLMERMKKN